MRTSLVLSLLSTALMSAGAINAQAADPYFYDPSNVGAGVYKAEKIHAPDAAEVPATSGYKLNRTIGCPGRALLDKTCPIEDADKDKVEDWTDKCPNTPAGMKVNALGCEIDTDGDGVLDSADKCPTVFAQTADGCPPVVAAPEAAPAAAPAPAPAPAPEAPIVVLGDVNFDFDKATLKPTADEKIDKAVAHVNKMSGEQFELKGYTDSIGSEAYNLKLSQKRADAVRNAMIKKGAPADRITAKGYGEASPAASNSTKAGRAENRRVELWGAKIEQVTH